MFKGHEAVFKQVTKNMFLIKINSNRIITQQIG